MGGGGYMEIIKSKIEGDERLSPDSMWAQKTLETNNLHNAWIQSSLEACVLKNSYPSFIKFWLINNETNTGYTPWWYMRAHWPNANIMLMGSTEW